METDYAMVYAIVYAMVYAMVFQRNSSFDSKVGYSREGLEKIDRKNYCMFVARSFSILFFSHFLDEILVMAGKLMHLSGHAKEGRNGKRGE